MQNLKSLAMIWANEKDILFYKWKYHKLEPIHYARTSFLCKEKKQKKLIGISLPKHELTPAGEIILKAEIASRKTYYTERQELLE